MLSRPSLRSFWIKVLPKPGQMPKEDSIKKGTWTKGKTSKKEWKRWNVQFTLDTVSLLYQGSVFYVEETKPDEDVEM